MKSLALYIHFPYCLYKCHYCDFNSYTVENTSQLEAPYFNALEKEFFSQQEEIGPFEIRSVFLGGGTPSLFSAEGFRKWLQIFRPFFASDLPEITIEANPKTLDLKKIDGFLEASINRISVGIQSFKDRYLAPLGRLHNQEEAKAALSIVKKSGIKNWNFDLMFGFPGQTLLELKEDLLEALEFDAPHLSVYQLTVEANTHFAKQVEQNRCELPEDETLVEMYEMVREMLKKSGYLHYEISNFAKPGFESRHNLAYWNYQNYLGLGAGAVSFLDYRFLAADDPQSYGWRFTNARKPQQYLALPFQAFRTREKERIGFKEAKSEFWMMGLRLEKGVLLRDFKERFGEDAENLYEAAFKRFIDRGWLIKEGDRVLLTDAGRLWASEVAASF